MLRILTTFILCCAFSASAYAACDAGSCIDVKITNLYVSENSWINISTNGVETNLDNCVPVSPTYVRLLTTHPNIDRIYSLLLSALMADKEVQLRLKDTPGNTGACEVTYVTIDG